MAAGLSGARLRAALLVGALASSALARKLVQVEKTACDGYDEDWDACPSSQPCETCVPVDCVFDEWSGWSDDVDCLGLRSRTRGIKLANNECGSPCTGTTSETESYSAGHCTRTGAQDCLFSNWLSWSSCSSPLDQAMRERTIEAMPRDGGMPCTGGLKETKSCGFGPTPVACQFSAWREWTDCSATCGVGRHTRMRRIEVEAEHGGTPCSDAVLETKSCQTQACSSQDCELGGWTEWSACDESKLQRFRQRKIVKPPLNGGLRCPAALTETSGCPELMASEDLEVSEWSVWTPCDKSCEGGQTYRERSVVTSALAGGSSRGHALKQAAACNTQPCEEAESCEFDTWSEWSDCTAQCGIGSKTRSRKVESRGTARGCQGALEEVVPCVHQDCDVVDCRWSEWDSWSACSQSCGGGSKRRNRIIAVAPERGGQPCEAQAAEEIAPCQTQSCDADCIDGQWGEWLEWTQCSATCSSGFRTRRRDISVQPSECGRPAAGLKEEFAVCDGLPPCVEVKNCSLTPWGAWSSCSDPCFGVRERQRHVETFAQGGGTPCQDALKVLEPCNPGPDGVMPGDCAATPTVDCVMGRWELWSACSRTCGGGQKTRERRIEQRGRGGGVPCEDALTLVEPCNTQPCEVVECQDCEVSQWSEWSVCSECGGQRYRSRSVEKPANSCGTTCESLSMREASNCTSACGDDLFCAWTAWTSAGECSGCGATLVRDRTLAMSASPPASGGMLFLAGKGDICSGSQLNVTACPIPEHCKPACEPVDCEFQPWTEWSSSSSMGLCERSRAVSRHNNECGEPCDGVIIETKECLDASQQALDCELSAWKEWNTCSPSGDGGQRYRFREIAQEPKNGGLPCTGVLQEMLGCHMSHTEPCQFGHWAEWAECSASCGRGFRKRTRSIVALATGGGAQCAGSLEEVQPCTGTNSFCDEPMLQDCLLGTWTAWSECDQDGQRYRHRSILEEALGGGLACNDTLQQTETCPVDVVDCIMSAWTNWDECDKHCGGGQTHRQRQIQTFPENGGMACPHDLIQTRGCNTSPCNPHSCTTSDWSVWGVCSVSCGVGFQERMRDVLSLRSPGGQGCDESLGETRACADSPACDVVDCAWPEWGEWTACSLTCGGGSRNRTRPLPAEPSQGGERCNAEDSSEVAPCNTQSCSAGACRDGQWGGWTEWTPCSVSCGGGTTSRQRQVAVMASECGEEPAGKDKEVAFCNVGTCEKSVDCAFSEWGAWSDCSGSCDGVKRRSRSIATQGSGDGDFCNGALKETAPCNPGAGEAAPEGCTAPDVPVNCELGPWSLWTQCSASCGGGQQSRSRQIAQEAQHGGQGCTGTLLEVTECGRDACHGPEPVDCLFGDWDAWSACTKCSGERKRFRHVTQYAQHGGQNCDSHYSEEVEECPRSCDEETFCTWGTWNAWSECSASCGSGGRRHRRRYLELTHEYPRAGIPVSVDDAMSKYEAAFRRTEDLERRHVQQLFLAFVAGCASLVVGFAAARACRQRGLDRDLPMRCASVPRSRPEIAGGSSMYQPLTASGDVELSSARSPGSDGVPPGFE